MTVRTTFFVIPVRNVGNGLAVLRAWRLVVLEPQIDPSDHLDHAPVDAPPAQPAEHRALGRDLLVAAGDTGFWQGAIRDPDDPFRPGLRDRFVAGGVLTVDLLYGDQEGAQLTISRFILTREEEGHWRPVLARQWALEGPQP